MSRAFPGDEVFFHHRGEPKVGKVLCTGRHGATVEHGKDRHKLKWEHITGFKKRAPQQYKVVEHGDDGMIRRGVRADDEDAAGFLVVAVGIRGGP